MAESRWPTKAVSTFRRRRTAARLLKTALWTAFFLWALLILGLIGFGPLGSLDLGASFILDSLLLLTGIAVGLGAVAWALHACSFGAVAQRSLRGRVLPRPLGGGPVAKFYASREQRLEAEQAERREVEAILGPMTCEERFAVAVRMCAPYKHNYAAWAVESLPAVQDDLAISLFLYFLRRSPDENRLRRAVIEQMNDQGALYLVFCSETWHENREAALERISDQRVLLRVAEHLAGTTKRRHASDAGHDGELLDIVLDRISDIVVIESAFRRLVLGRKVWPRHICGLVRRIQNPRLLKRFIAKIPALRPQFMLKEACAAALERLTEISGPDVPGSVALRHPSPFVREVALSRVDSPDVVAQVARGDRSSEVRDLATRHVLAIMLGGRYEACRKCCGSGYLTQTSVVYGEEVFGPYGGETGFRTPDVVTRSRSKCCKCSGRGWLVAIDPARLEAVSDTALDKAREEAQRRSLL